MNQISIFRRTTKHANVPVSRNGFVLQDVGQVPWDVMSAVRNYARGATTVQRLREWRWEWQQVGK